MTIWAVALAGLAAGLGCRAAAVEHIRTPPEGLAISLYDRGDGTSYGVVDDRRELEVTAGHPLVLPRIDPGAALPSLVIESLAGGALELGACSRETFDNAAAEESIGERRISARARLLLQSKRVIDPVDSLEDARTPVAAQTAAPTVTCEVVHAVPGRHLVRILYVSAALGYEAQHDLAVRSADRAVVSSHFAMATPLWRVRADITLFDGVPGGEHPPRELTHGPIALDGSIAVLVVPAHEIAAHLRRIYDGAIIVPGVPKTDLMWNHRSTSAIWVSLELDDAPLPPGQVHVHVELADEEPRDVVVPASSRTVGAAEPARLVLWQDPDLRGMRQPGIDHADGATLADRMVYSITNVGTVPHEVWIEEHLRPAKHRKVVRAWPAKPTVHDDLLRTKLTVAPEKTERVGFTVDYDF